MWWPRGGKLRAAEAQPGWVLKCKGWGKPDPNCPISTYSTIQEPGLGADLLTVKADRQSRKCDQTTQPYANGTPPAKPHIFGIFAENREVACRHKTKYEADR